MEDESILLGSLKNGIIHGFFSSNGNAIPEDSIGIFIELLKDLSGSIQCDGTSVPKFQWISSMQWSF